MTADAAAIWPELRARLKTSVPDRAFRLYLAGLDPIACRDGVLVLAAHPDACRWVQARFGQLLNRVLIEVAGGALRAVEVIEAGSQGAAGDPKLTGACHAPALGQLRHTFERFVIGAGNRLAHAAALAVAEQPGQAYNPLILCGRRGVGKTHLMGAIARYVDRHGGGLSAGCVRAETFTTEFRRALTTGAMEGFKARYRSLDLLTIDDAHFFSGKPRTQEELAHTLAALTAAGSQIVLAADHAPGELANIDAGVREQLASGLVCEIQPPDRATRLGILRQRASTDAVALADPLFLEILADHDTSDVRLLEGALVRAVALASLSGRPLDSELAREVLAGLASRSSSDPIEAVQHAAAAAFGLSCHDLLSRSRASRVTWPRHVAIYLARELSGQSLPAIGRRFGGRNHATILNSWRQTAERIAADPDARQVVEDLRRSLTHRTTTPPRPGGLADSS